MYGRITSGNTTVDTMGMINISGNVIPQIWYSTITRLNGKPYLLAITLLADIVYWYRPVEERDECSGKVIGWKKRFKGDLLQKTYKQYAELYGESARSIKAALDRLEELGLIRKIFRDVELENGTKMNNIMFISLNPDILYHFTYPTEDTEIAYEQEREESAETSSSLEMELCEYVQENAIGEIEGQLDKKDASVTDDKAFSDVPDTPADPPTKFCTTLLQNDVPPPTKFCTTLLQNDVPPPTKFCTTPLQNNVPPPTKFCRYTKNTTENTNKDYINQSINQGNMLYIQQSNDEMDAIDAYTQLVKKNIEYKTLKHDRGYQSAQIDEIVELIVETICVKREYVRIGGADYPYQLVKQRLLKLNFSHIQYVLSCMQRNTTKIANIRAYLLTTLYNATGTMDNYYQTAVNHELHGYN